MTRIKLGLLTLLALTVSSVTLAAVAQSASTVQTVRVNEVSYGIRFSAKPKAVRSNSPCRTAGRV